MPDEDQDDSQKTEDPTQKRLDDAMKKGQVPNSREVTSFLMLLVFTLAIIWIAPGIMKKTSLSMVRYIESPNLLRIDSSSIMVLSKDILSDSFILMVTPVSIIILVILLSHFIQHPLILSTDAPMPKLERISPIKGLGRLFSMRTLVEFIKGLFKIIMVGIISYIAIKPDLPELESLPSESIMAILLLISKMAARIMIGICSFMALVSVIDFLYQKFEYTKSLRMSKRDLRDEFKQTEGSPEAKARLREIRNQRANKRMMSNVPKSDVVITNPTHYSIALQYDAKVTEAPVVVAKGKDLIALKIREIAKENKIPIVENPPLARALFDSVEIDQEIPVEHYNAVAEVIRYVYSLKKKAS